MSCVGVLLATASCSDKVVETPLTFRRTATKACRATIGGSPREMNTYWIDLWAIPLVANDTGQVVEACAACQMSGACTLVARRCVCGPPIAPGVENLTAALSGQRFTELDASYGYCLSVVALQAAHGQVGVNKECSCRPEWLMDPGPSADATPGSADGGGSVNVVETIRACALTKPFRIGDQMTLDLQCLDDGSISCIHPIGPIP